MGFLRATLKKSFPKQDDYVNCVTVEDFKVIGRIKAYDERSNF